MDKSNTTKRVGLIGALVFLIAVLCFLAKRNLRNFESDILEQTQQHLLNIAKSEAQSIEEFVGDVQDELQMLSEDPRLSNAVAKSYCIDKCDTEDADDYCGVAALYRHLRGRVNSLYRLDANGIIQCRVPWKENRVGADYSRKPGVKIVLESHKPYVSEWFESSSGNYKSISICYPVFTNDSFSGVVRAVIRLDVVSELVSHIKVGQRGHAWIIDDSGQVMVHPDPNLMSESLSKLSHGQGLGDETEENEVISEMLQGTSGARTFVFDEFGGSETVMAWAPIKIGERLWSIGVCMGYDEVSGPVVAHTRNLLAGASLLVVVLIGAGIILNRITHRQSQLEARLRSSRELESVNEQLQEEIAERERAESHLQRSLEDMKRFNRLAVGRELRMIELKKEVDSFLVELGREIKYGFEKEGISGRNAESKSVSSGVDDPSIEQDNNEEV
ncbi:MAG: cache domain-containing protein [Planctomycetota bacterium]|jgi:hypothetical protein